LFDYLLTSSSLLHNLSLRAVSDRPQRVAGIAPAQGEAWIPEIEEWVANEVVKNAVNDCVSKDATAADGGAIGTLVAQYQTLDYLKTRYVNVVSM
jgi:hypothetical protein